MTPEIAVLIPCFNEQETVGAVVSAFRAHLPQAMIFVYDNASTDSTIERARNAGAIVRSEPLRGKGYVVRRMFADIEADIYVLVDGDGTYDAARAPALIDALVRESLDLVSAVRVDSSQRAYRSGHRFGNWLLTRLVAQLFGKRFSDMLSGYRVMSRRFIKSFPALSTGFEIETELTVHALQMRIPIAELPTSYRERPEGSASKLRTLSDGMRIMRTIAYLLKEERPGAALANGGARNGPDDPGVTQPGLRSDPADRYPRPHRDEAAALSFSPDQIPPAADSRLTRGSRTARSSASDPGVVCARRLPRLPGGRRRAASPGGGLEHQSLSGPSLLIYLRRHDDVAHQPGRRVLIHAPAAAATARRMGRLLRCEPGGRLPQLRGIRDRGASLALTASHPLDRGCPRLAGRHDLQFSDVCEVCLPDARPTG